METLAYTHLSLAYEAAANPEQGADELKVFKGLHWKLPSSAWIGLIASFMALSILNLASNTLAAYVRTNGSSLNIRSSPAGRIVGSLDNGTAFSPSGQTSGDWTQLAWGNWVSSYWINGGSSGGSGGGGGGTPSGYLQLGSRGQAVVNLQNRLKALGFYNGPVTGYYGNLTETAIRQFQSSRGIQVNGIAGSQTQAALYGTSGSSSGSSSNPYAGNYLQRGSSGQSVVNLQNRLRVLGFFTGAVTGYYGSLTETAVRQFQSSRAIQVNGIAGPQTLAAIYGSNAISSSGTSSSNNSTATSGTEAIAVVSVNVLSAPGGYTIYNAPKGSYLYLTGRKAGSWVELQGGGWVSDNNIQYTGQPV